MYKEKILFLSVNVKESPTKKMQKICSYTFMKENQIIFVVI